MLPTGVWLCRIHPGPAACLGEFCTGILLEAMPRRSQSVSDPLIALLLICTSFVHSRLGRRIGARPGSMLTREKFPVKLGLPTFLSVLQQTT